MKPPVLWYPVFFYSLNIMIFIIKPTEIQLFGQISITLYFNVLKIIKSSLSAPQNLLMIFKRHVSRN